MVGVGPVTQDDTIARLNALTTPEWRVDAAGLPTEATEACANDSDHGPGTCYLPGADGLCPDCAVTYLGRWVLLAGAHVAVDVLQT